MAQTVVDLGKVVGSPGAAGAPGTPGAKGDTGAPGPQGNPTTVNGKSGSSITLNAGDVGALPSAGGTITGNLTLKGPTDYGNKINFGDGDYVYISEPFDDAMELKGSRINFIGMVTNIAQSGTSDPGASSSLATGSIYLVYE